MVLEAVPKRLQRAYSARAAQWLAERLGTDSSEWAAAIGEHFHRAGESAEAARYMTRAGEQAIQVSAFEDARGFLDRALSLLHEGGGSDAQEASVRLHLAEALWRLGDYPKAKENLAAAMAKASRPEDSRLRAEVLYHMAQVALSQGDLEGARRRFEESLDTADVEDQVAQGRALFGLGEVAWRSGDQEAAAEHLEAALILARQTNDTVQVMDCLHRLGSVARSRGDFEAARAHMEECRAQALETGSRDRLAAALDGLGEVLRHQGDLEGARECFQESLALAEAIGLHMAAVWARTNLAFVEIDLGEKEEARGHLRQSLRQAHEHGESEGTPLRRPGVRGLAGRCSRSGPGRRGPAPPRGQRVRARMRGTAPSQARSDGSHTQPEDGRRPRSGRPGQKPPGRRGVGDEARLAGALREGFEHGDLAGPAVRGDGLEDEGDAVRPRVLHDEAEGLEPELPFAEAVVPVHPAPQPRLAVVEVHGLQVFRPDDPVEVRHGGIVGRPVAEVAPRGVEVGRVQAYAHAGLVLHPLDHVGELLEGVAQVAPLPRRVLEDGRHARGGLPARGSRIRR